MILKEYNLSVRLPQERAIDTGISLVQNDKDVYKLNIRIFDGVNEIDYSEVDSATITFLKRDNNVVQGNMTVEADQLSYTLGTNEIACPGKVLVGIQLWGSTERLSTARFVMQVEKDLITEDAVQSTSEFPILQQLKQDLEAIDVVKLTNQFNAHKAESASFEEAGHIKLGILENGALAVINRDFVPDTSNPTLNLGAINNGSIYGGNDQVYMVVGYVRQSASIVGRGLWLVHKHETGAAIATVITENSISIDVSSGNIILNHTSDLSRRLVGSVIRVL